MIQHSKTPVTLTIGGERQQFGRFLPKDILDIVQWANDRERERAMALIPCEDVEDRIKVFKQCGSRYSVFTLNEMLEDSSILLELLYRCWAKANDGTREEFFESFGNTDIGMMQAWVDELAGVADAPKNQERQTTESEPDEVTADSHGQQSSPLSASTTQD